MKAVASRTHSPSVIIVCHCLCLKRNFSATGCQENFQGKAAQTKAVIQGCGMHLHLFNFMNVMETENKQAKLEMFVTWVLAYPTIH